MEHMSDIPSTTKKTRSLFGAGLAILLATATFFSGLHVGSGQGLEASIGSFFPRETQADTAVDLTEFWNVWNILESKYVGSTTALSKEERVRGAIRGLVDSYEDPYTVYFPPQEAEAFAEEIAGNFGGVGMDIFSHPVPVLLDGHVTLDGLADKLLEAQFLLAGGAGYLLEEGV